MSSLWRSALLEYEHDESCQICDEFCQSSYNFYQSYKCRTEMCTKLETDGEFVNGKRYMCWFSVRIAKYA